MEYFAEKLGNSHVEVGTKFQYLKRLVRGAKPKTRTPARTVSRRVLRKQAIGILRCDFWYFMWSERKTGDIRRTVNDLERRLEEETSLLSDDLF